MPRPLLVLLSGFLCCNAWAQELNVQKPPVPEPPPAVAKKPVDRTKEAATDLGQVDADFWLQGEYLGSLQGSWQGCNLVGIQVIALGGGKFEAVILRGGLPGAGWDRATKIKLSGERFDAIALLHGENLKLTVDGRTAILQSLHGGHLGPIRKLNRISATQDASPPPGAIVLFDGRASNALQNAKVAKDGLLQVGAMTTMPVHDFQMHLEFRTPYMPYARGQGRGNSGVYIQQRYEVQVLDSFGLEGADNECGGLYKQQRPAVNMCLPPLSWQTYDISFSAARWNSGGEKIAPARMTVLHNGEPIHFNYALTAKTGGGKAEGPEPFPILLQNHSNPVMFRNVWMVPGTPGIHQRGHFAFDPTCEPSPSYYTIPFGHRAYRGFAF